jgi:hypothetical protein
VRREVDGASLPALTWLAVQPWPLLAGLGGAAEAHAVSDEALEEAHAAATTDES